MKTWNKNIRYLEGKSKKINIKKEDKSQKKVRKMYRA